MDLQFWIFFRPRSAYPSNLNGFRSDGFKNMKFGSSKSDLVYKSGSGSKFVAISSCTTATLLIHCIILYTCTDVWGPIYVNIYWSEHYATVQPAQAYSWACFSFSFQSHQSLSLFSAWKYNLWDYDAIYISFYVRLSLFEGKIDRIFLILTLEAISLLSITFLFSSNILN